MIQCTFTCLTCFQKNCKITAVDVDYKYSIDLITIYPNTRGVQEGSIKDSEKQIICWKTEKLANSIRPKKPIIQF